MTTTSADKTLVSAFLYDFHREAGNECIRYIAPDGTFVVSVEQKSGSDYGASIELDAGVTPSNEVYRRAQNFVSLLV